MSSARGFRLRAHAFLLACACAASACAGSQRPQGTTPREQETCPSLGEVPSCALHLDDLGRDLDTLLSMAAGGDYAPNPTAEPIPEGEAGPGPDCSAARDLRDRICELQASICELATRPDAVADTQARCESARASCERARNSVARVCQ